jgi:hypothetical protein
MASYEEFEAWQSGQNPDQPAGVAVGFIVSGDDAGLKVLPPAEIPTVKARVLGNHRIVCGGIFTGGDVFDAPHNDETRLWLRQGYVELVPETTSKKGKSENAL